MIEAAVAVSPSKIVLPSTFGPVTDREPLDTSEINYVRSKWRESYFRGLAGLPFGVPDKKTFYARHWEAEEATLPRCQIRISVRGACIIAFAVVEIDAPIVHYAYTIEPERRRGHVRRLLEDACGEPWRYSHETHPGRLFARQAFRDVGIFDPTLFQRKEI